MNGALQSLSPAALMNLASAIEARLPLDQPFLALQFQRLGFGVNSAAIAAELQSMRDVGLSSAALPRFLRLIADERMSAQKAADRTELVWTGPELRGAGSRDTAVVVRELFAWAERSVHVATYVIYDGKRVFSALAKRIDERPDLKVRVFVHIPRKRGDKTPTNQLLKVYGDTFRRQHWPGSGLPQVFYDPRSLTPNTGPRAVLHAKAIAVDDARAFVTSANFTEAAHDRNIEAGVLIESASFAMSLRQQFDSLVEAGLLIRLPL